jgi:hypothetical protein
VQENISEDVGFEGLVVVAMKSDVLGCNAV